MGGRQSGRQEKDAVGYVASTVRKETEMTETFGSLYSFIQHRILEHGMVPPTFNVGLPISVNPS